MQRENLTMNPVTTLKRSALGLAAAAVLATSLLGAGGTAHADSRSLTNGPDTSAKCWTTADGSVKCKACIYFDGGSHCFVYTKSGPTNPAPAPERPSGAYMDYIASGLS